MCHFDIIILHVAMYRQKYAIVENIFTCTCIIQCKINEKDF